MHCRKVGGFSKKLTLIRVARNEWNKVIIVVFSQIYGLEMSLHFLHRI